jgi:hypothetical protein
LLNEEIKKKNSESNELKEIFSNENIKINQELKFYKTITIVNITETKKEESVPKKIKKTQNRV